MGVISACSNIFEQSCENSLSFSLKFLFSNISLKLYDVVSVKSLQSVTKYLIWEFMIHAL